MANKTKVVTVRLTDEQYAFFIDWQKKLEAEKNGEKAESSEKSEKK